MTALIGANLTEVFSSLDEGKGFGLGDAFTDHQGRRYIFARANGAVTGAGYVCFLDANLDAAMLSTANDGPSQRLAVAMAAMADNDYGWFQIEGIASIAVLASAAAGARLNTTATAGVLDDDGALGSFAVLGAALTTANGGSTAATAGYLAMPPTTYTVAL